jgi:hypothetical protein
MSANYDRTWVYYEAFEYISYIELAPNILITNRKSNKNGGSQIPLFKGFRLVKYRSPKGIFLFKLNTIYQPLNDFVS